jgi:hypothetical protein
MMTNEEMQRTLKIEEKKLQEIQALNEKHYEYVHNMRLEGDYPAISALSIETAILTINQVIEENLTEDDLLQILEDENQQMYDLEKSYQKVSNFLRDLGPISIPVPIQYLRARTNTIRRLLQQDVTKAFR